MSNNPEIQFTRVSLTTAGVANATTTQNLLAAPGAGLRYRIFAIYFNVPQNAGALILRGRLVFNASTGQMVWAGQATNSQGAGENWYPQGIPGKAANQSVDLVDACSVVSITYDAIVHWVVESA